MTTGPRDILSPFDVTLPPPKTWIDETLIFDRPEQLGRLTPSVMLSMLPNHEALKDLFAYGSFAGNHNVVLAERILGGTPHCFYGDNALNRYAHGAWALVTLGRDDDAWKLVEKIPPVADRTRMPMGTLRMTTFMALRCGRAHDAISSWNALAKWHRGSLTDEDMSLKTACEQMLRSIGG